MGKKSNFAKYGLDEQILSQLPLLGFRRPTQVQEKVIPLFIQKKNLIVEAPTGTGKTAAYGLPLLHRLNLLKRSTQALVLVPSRELVQQISEALRSFSANPKLRIGQVTGGVPMSETHAVLKSGAQVVVAVPGRLRDAMSKQSYDFFWRDIKFLMVDEGDKLLEMGFQKDFDIIRKNVRKSAQFGFFSATISRDAELLIRERISPAMTVRLHPQEMLRNISFYYVNVAKGRREAFLAALFQQKEVEKALVFCSKREDVYAVSGFLRNAGLKAETYYGSQEQSERQNILRRFKEGHIDYLVATDLAARGLDIAELPAVINLNVPDQFQYYLHRVGRTGRAGSKGKVYNLVVSEIEKTILKNHHKLILLPLSRVSLDYSIIPEKSKRSPDTFAKYLISRGKKDKLRKGDIVGFLINQAGLEADAIGTITIYDNYATVDMSSAGFAQLMQAGDGLQIKGKSVRVRKLSVDEQQKKARKLKSRSKNHSRKS